VQIVPGCDYFASKLLLGPDGVQEIYPLGTLTDYEKTKLEEVIPMLQGNIKKVSASLSSATCSVAHSELLSGLHYVHTLA
jgi:malate/lactate dehydrogenase